jgi:hypothetical protein
MPASRKTRGRPDAGSHPGPVSAPVSAPNSAPVEESPKDEAPVESRPHTEGKRAKVAAARRRRQHGTAYRWIVAYLPIMALLFALLGAVWIYTGFINPPPPTPAQQWTKIENKWSPVREKDRAAIAADTLDFVKQQADYTDFNTQTKGWLDAVTAVKDWGVGASSVSSFLDDGKQYLLVLQQVEAAKTPYDVIALTATLTQWDTQFTTDVAQIETDLSLPATSPVPSGLALPSVNPTPTPTPGPSGSAAPSGSPGATPSPGVSPVPSPGTVASPTSSPS